MSAEDRTRFLLDESITEEIREELIRLYDIEEQIVDIRNEMNSQIVAPDCILFECWNCDKVSFEHEESDSFRNCEWCGHHVCRDCASIIRPSPDEYCVWVCKEDCMSKYTIDNHPMKMTFAYN